MCLVPASSRGGSLVGDGTGASAIVEGGGGEAAVSFWGHMRAINEGAPERTRSYHGHAQRGGAVKGGDVSVKPGSPGTLHNGVRQVR